jgi:hypothetical protein
MLSTILFCALAITAMTAVVELVIRFLWRDF